MASSTKQKFKKNDLQQRFESFVENLDFTQLQEHEDQELEDEISIDEVRNALKGFQITNLLAMRASQKSSMKLSLTFEVMCF